MRKKINKISIALSIVLVFLGMMGFGQTTLDPSKKSIQAWIYPGDPACDASNEFKDGRFINTLKPEYLTLNSSGSIILKVTTPDCNQYTVGNATEVKNNSSFQFITVSGKEDNLNALLNKSNTEIISDFINTIVYYVNLLGYTGVELDFEHPTGGWNTTRWNRYKYIINELGKELHKPQNNKLLMIDGPGLTTEPTSTSNNQWDYSDFYSDNQYLDLPTSVDFICVMAYDSYWDIWEANMPNNVTDNFGGVSPTAWVEQVINYVKSEMTSANINKIIIGMPSYGYHAITTTDFSVDTKKETAGNPFYGPNLRDPLSFERYFTDANNIKWYYQDVIGMCEKIEFIRSKGIKHVSVWHLGGNDWFNRFDININDNSILDPDYKLPSTCLPASSIVKNTTYSFPGQYYYSTTNKTIDNQNDRNHYAKINSSAGSNTLEFGGYTFTAATSGNNYVSGFEVIVIGRTENNNVNLSDPLYKSDLFVQLSYNGQDAPPIPFSIYSHHAVCKLFGSTTDMMGLAAINGTINSSFKVKIYHSSGADACITAVFVKPYYSPSSPIPPSCTYNAIPYNISTVMPVWSNTKLFNNDIVIKSGGVLTISGTVKFTEQAKIIVEPGGKLIVDGGTLTNLCNNQYWKGITVTGHYSQSQFDLSQHGKVSLINGASISNAVCAIQTLRENNDNTRGGGVIYAWNANFINNQTGVKMRKFTNKNLSGYPFIDISTFKNCNFITDNNYITPTTKPFLQFINLDKIKGVEIFGCQFKNNSTNIAPDFSNAGIGIYSNESYYNIDNSVNQTEFYKLQYGIKSISALTEKPIRVKRALFINNLHGIYAKNYTKAWLTANTFKIRDNFTQTNAEVAESDNTAYGMYLDHCTDYILEGNSFNKVDNAVNKAAYGLIINETGAPFDAANSVYNNSFQNIERAATQSQGNNRGYNYDKGLKIHCNDYTSNKHDISVVPVITGGGISQFQGTDASGNTTDDKKRPAGNTFSKFGPTITDFTDINNGGPNFKYFHHNFNNDDTKTWYPKFCNAEPNYTNILRKNTGAEYTIKSEVCPGKALQTGLPEPIPYEPIQLNNIIQQKTAQLNTSKLIYTLWVDNGNTEGLRHDIKISASWDAFELYNKLLLGSPKLSDEVLIDAIKREDVLTPLMLKLILLANPQSTRSDRVWEALLNRSNPLPEAWIDEIKQGLEVISPIENMQADISYYASERNTYMNLLKQCYLSDTTETGMQQYLSLLDNESDIESKYELVFAKIGNQDYEGALSTLSSIETMIDREKYPEEADRHAKMTNLIPVLITIKSSNPKWEELSENDRNLLINLSETDNTVTGSLATSCRMALDAGFVYEEPIYIPTDKPLKMAAPKKSKTAVANEKQIKISPNPATDYIAIECNTEGFGNNLRLQITDALGKTVFEKELGKAQQIIDIREFAKGSYYCTVYNNGKALDTVKFIKK